jgi:ferrochelatase
MKLKTGVLLVNLGTPDSPSVKDVRKYLREFLIDERVLDINPVSRWFLINFIIAPFRSPKSAKSYKEIWSEKGSPLLYYSNLQKELLQQKLGADFQVELAMRYGSPSIKDVLQKFSKTFYDKIIVLPLFPQYASASTGSAHQRIMEEIKSWLTMPEIDFINSYHNHSLYIKAFTEIGKRHSPENYDHIIFSFHGLPERQMVKANCFNHCLKENCCATLTEKNAFCYRAQCFDTARLLAATLSLPVEKYTVSFQSRLGRAEWVKPYTTAVLAQRTKAGDKRILMFSPAFTADCLETIFEIGTEYDLLFKSMGGEKVQMVESLNDNPVWIDAMKEMVTSRVAK